MNFFKESLYCIILYMYILNCFITMKYMYIFKNISVAASTSNLVRGIEIGSTTSLASSASSNHSSAERDESSRDRSPQERPGLTQHQRLVRKASYSKVCSLGSLNVMSLQLVCAVTNSYK